MTGLEGIIPELRRRAGLSEEEAGEKLGLPEELYSRYERGDREMPVRVLGWMADCFGITAEAVIWGRGIRFRIEYRGGRVEVEREETGEESATPDPGKAAPPEPKKEDPVPAVPPGPKKEDPADWSRKGPRKPKPLDFEGPTRKILEWQRTYSTGLAFFDGPHRDFIDTANSLYTASLIGGWESAREPFDQAVRQIGRYVQDMGNEEVMMERTGYPGYGAHKREHRIFLRELGVQVRNYRNGLRIDVRKFVLFLRDWVLSHMGISDRTFALHLLRLRREGALTGIIMRVKRQKAGRVIIR